MKTIYILILAVGTAFLFSCTKENSLLDLERAENVSNTTMTTLSNGPCCPYHLTEPCPSECFSGGNHICLNPDHCNLTEKVTEIAPDEGGGGGSGSGNNNGNNNHQVCDKCASCLACIDILNGLPYVRHLHTCDCGSDICCNPQR